MNFPKNQQIGVVAENKVERLFFSWGWNVGHDRIDMGYDLFVTPEQAKYLGARLLVQVKGTAQKKKRTIVTHVSKARLRQYAESELAVFIMRVTADGDIYWIHAQEWARANRQKLSGPGDAGIRFDATRRAEDRGNFELYLQEVLRPLPEEIRALRDLAEESRVLSSLDPHFGVRIQQVDGKRQHEIFAKKAPATGRVAFLLGQAPHNVQKLNDALDYGLPRTIEVQDFVLTGSPLLDRLGIKGSGTLSIGQKIFGAGYARLLPGSEFSITAADLPIEVEIYSGQKGLALTNESKSSFFNFSVRFTRESENIRTSATIGFRLSAFTERSIRDLIGLGALVQWVDQVESRGALFMELLLNGRRLSLGFPAAELKSLEPFLHWLRVVSKLHLVARALDSRFRLPIDFQLTDEDARDVSLAYSVLKGERVPVDINKIEFEPNEPFEFSPEAEYRCTTTLLMKVLGQDLGHLPVVIDLVGFIAEPVREPGKVQLSNNGDGKAWISYGDPHESRDEFTIARL